MRKNNSKFNFTKNCWESFQATKNLKMFYFTGPTGPVLKKKGYTSLDRHFLKVFGNSCRNTTWTSSFVCFNVLRMSSMFSIAVGDKKKEFLCGFLCMIQKI